VKKLLPHDQTGLAVYENLWTVPKAFVLRDWYSGQALEEFVKTIEADPLEAIHHKAFILNADMPRTELPPPASVKAAEVLSIEKWQPDSIHLTAEAPEGGILVLTENFHRDWTATVNGESVEVFPSFGILRSIVLPKANLHSVKFEFRPLAKTLFPLTWVLAGILLILMYIFNRKQRFHPPFAQD
jgi:hypothetical protein